MIKLAVLGAISLGALLCHEVNAAGFFTPSHGARIQGRGGAGVLSATDMNAMWYNPAMLAGLGRFHLTVDATLLAQDASFARAPRTLENGQTLKYPEVKNQANPLVVPQIGVASHLGAERFVFALGVWAPNGVPGRYPEEGPQRYTLIDTEGSFVLSTGLAVAWRPTDWLWIGAGLQNHFVRIRLVNMLTAWPGFIGDPEDPSYDLLFEGVISSSWTPSANVGARVQVVESLELGLSVQLPVHARDERAQIKQRLPSHVLFDEAMVLGDTVTASFQLPWIIRGGARYVRPRWDLELNVVLERWSSFEQIEIQPNQIEVDGVIGLGSLGLSDLSVPRNYQDTLSVRLGGDVKVIPQALEVRGGLFFEQSAVPTSTLSVLQIDADKLGLSAGLTWYATPYLGVDLAYTHLFYRDRSVNASVVKQINPAIPGNMITVGEGDYQLSVDLVGVGMRLDL